MSNQWRPIADLPSESNNLTTGELLPLVTFWRDQQTLLNSTGLLKSFNQELAREWAIETGQIEGVYDIDRGTTRVLIERGINPDLIPRVSGQQLPEVTAAILQSHLEVLDGLFDFIKGDRTLSKGYIHELHAALLRQQEIATAVDQFGTVLEVELIKGQYKKRPNNPTRPDGSVHQYCPPEHVDSEMERLVEIHAQHVASEMPVEVQSAWLHHRFTQIHPYQDGNGRVARALATLVFIKAGWFPVVVTRDDRVRYLDALEIADSGDLQALVALLIDVQKRSLFQATQAAANVIPVSSVDDAIASIKHVLLGSGRSLDPQVWAKSKVNADHLIKVALQRFEEVVQTLSVEISNAQPEFTFQAAPWQSSSVDHPKLGYNPNLSDYNNGALLSLRSAANSYLKIYGHAIGSKFRGLIGLVAFYTQGETNERQTVSDSVFQVNYIESQEDTEKRFSPWLEKAITEALVLWRKNL